MIITTGDSIEGKKIIAYRGLVFGKSTTSDIFIFNDKQKYQDLYAKWVKEAEDALKTNAERAGANAVIGVRQEVLTKSFVILMLIGTAVVVE